MRQGATSPLQAQFDIASGPVALHSERVRFKFKSDQADNLSTISVDVY
jgi:hypothetical protein